MPDPCNVLMERSRGECSNMRISFAERSSCELLLLLFTVRFLLRASGSSTSIFRQMIIGYFGELHLSDGQCNHAAIACALENSGSTFGFTLGGRLTSSTNTSSNPQFGVPGYSADIANRHQIRPTLGSNKQRPNSNLKVVLDDNMPIGLERKCLLSWGWRLWPADVVRSVRKCIDHGCSGSFSLILDKDTFKYLAPPFEIRTPFVPYPSPDSAAPRPRGIPKLFNLSSSLKTHTHLFTYNGFNSLG